MAGSFRGTEVVVVTIFGRPRNLRVRLEVEVGVTA